MRHEPDIVRDAEDDAAFLDWLCEEGYSMATPMPDGMWCGVKRLLFHYTLHIGVMGDRTGYEDRYCYVTFSGATQGLREWRGRGFEGEPTGWRKHPKTDRCRNDEGDPESETIGWSIR